VVSCCSQTAKLNSHGAGFVVSGMGIKSPARERRLPSSNVSAAPWKAQKKVQGTCMCPSPSSAETPITPTHDSVPAGWCTKIMNHPLMVFAKPRCHCRIRKRNPDDLCPPVPEQSPIPEHGAEFRCTGQSYKFLRLADFNS